MCGHEFDEKAIGKSCQGCGKKDCEILHCPNCGYGNSPEFKIEFKFITSLKDKLRSKKKK